jgi:thymidylate synthase
MKTYNNFTQAYVSLIKDVYYTPEFESAPRGMKVRERLGHSFRITNILDRIPYVPHREFSIAYMIAEMVWYLSGNNSTEWISNYSAFWRNISDDGVTANSAYGARIFKQHDYHFAPHDAGDGASVDTFYNDISPLWTQWQYIKDELKKDSDSRRAVIHIRMPQDSVLAQKDVPCTLTLQFFIRDGELHQVASMRSSDIILGIAYDIPAFTLFQELLALELGVGLGTYTHISNSLHIYERHFEMVERILEDPWVKEFPNRCKPMESMPSEPPLDRLVLEEMLLRSVKTQDALQEWVDTLKAEHTIQTYWKDWLLILASHRAQKLDLPEFRDKLINSVHFSGYKLFKK